MTHAQFSRNELRATCCCAAGDTLVWGGGVLPSKEAHGAFLRTRYFGFCSLLIDRWGSREACAACSMCRMISLSVSRAQMCTDRQSLSKLQPQPFAQVVCDRTLQLFTQFEKNMQARRLRSAEPSILTLAFLFSAASFEEQCACRFAEPLMCRCPLPVLCALSNSASAGCHYPAFHALRCLQLK